MKMSVVIPVFNRRIQLARCLQSLVGQTDKDFDVIIYDDGSTVLYDDILNKYSKLLEIVYLKNENSGGPAKPRNVGCSLAKGEWIGFLDCDDTYFPEKIEVIKAHIKKHPNAIFFYHQLVVSNLSGQYKYDKKVIGKPIKKEILTKIILDGNPIPTSSVVINKNFFASIGGFSEELELAGVEDFDLWMKAYHTNPNFHFIKRVLGEYFVEPDSISKTSPKQLIAYRKLYDNLRKFIPENEQKKFHSIVNYKINNIKYNLKLLNAVPFPTIITLRTISNFVIKNYINNAKDTKN